MVARLSHWKNFIVKISVQDVIRKWTWLT